MSSSVQTLLNAVVDELGIMRPSGYVGGADVASRQLVALLHAVGDYIVSQAEWQALILQGTIATVAGTADYALPSDWTAFIDETQWNSTQRAPMSGPRNQRDWAQVEGSGVNIGPYFAQQLRGNRVRLQPTPTSVETLTYYYLSGNWVSLAAGGSAERVASDNDTCIWLDDRMIVLGVKAYWLRSKRLSYDEEMDQFEKRIISERAANRGSKTLSMDPRESQGYGQTGFIIPVGSWPL